MRLTRLKSWFACVYNTFVPHSWTLYKLYATGFLFCCSQDPRALWSDNWFSVWAHIRNSVARHITAQQSVEEPVLSTIYLHRVLGAENMIAKLQHYVYVLMFFYGLYSKESELLGTSMCPAWKNCNNKQAQIWDKYFNQGETFFHFPWQHPAFFNRLFFS